MKSVLNFSNTQLYAILSLVSVFVIDLVTPLGFATGLLYVLCFLIIYQESKKTIISFSIIISIMIITKLLIYFPTHEKFIIDYWTIVVNRALSVFTIFIASLLALRHRTVFEKSNFEQEKQSAFVSENYANDSAIRELFYFPSKEEREDVHRIAGLNSNQLFAIIGLIIVFTVDLLVPLGVAIGSFYVICFLFVFQENRKTIVLFALITILLILIKAFAYYGVVQYTSYPDNIVFSNRLISVFVVVITSILAIRHRTLLDKLNHQRELYIHLLEEANNKLEAMQQSIDTHLMYVMTNPEGIIIYANKRFCEASGYNEQELIGKSPRIIKSNFHPKEFYEHLWKTIAAGNMWRGEIKNKAKNGTYYWVDATVLPVKDKSGNIVQYLAMHNSIDERKKMEEQIKRNHQEMESFAYIATHDLKSPIVNISSLLHLMEESGGTNDQNRVFVDKIKLSVSQMQNTLTKLNDAVTHKSFSAADNEVLEFNKELNAVMESVSELIKSSGGIVQTDFSRAQFVRFNRTELHSILQNLITNALKFSRPGVVPQIQIKTSKNNSDVVLEISDNGAGIDLSLNKDKLFGLFKRFHKNSEGKGVGLYIVKSIIERHGGNIDVESKVNEGTTFRLCFINQN